MYSRAMLCPPRIAVWPSKTAILRWFRRLAEPRELEREHRHETMHLAARLPDRRREAAAAEQAADRVEQQPDLHPLACARWASSSTTRRPVASRPRMNVIRLIVWRASQNAALEFAVGLLAGAEKPDGIAAQRRTARRARDRHGGGAGGDDRRCGAFHRDGGRQARLAGSQPAQLPAAEDQIERHADVGDEHDAKQPGDRVARLALLAHQARDEENRQQEADDGKQVAQNFRRQGVCGCHRRESAGALAGWKADSGAIPCQRCRGVL